MSSVDFFEEMRSEWRRGAEEEFERACRPLKELLGKRSGGMVVGGGKKRGGEERYEDRIVEVLRHRPGLRARELARETGIPLAGVRQAVYKNPTLKKKIRSQGGMFALRS